MILCCVKLFMMNYVMSSIAVKCMLSTKSYKVPPLPPPPLSHTTCLQSVIIPTVQKAVSPNLPRKSVRAAISKNSYSNQGQSLQISKRMEDRLLDNNATLLVVLLGLVRRQWIPIMSSFYHDRFLFKTRAHSGDHTQTFEFQWQKPDYFFLKSGGLINPHASVHPYSERGHKIFKVRTWNFLSTNSPQVSSTANTRRCATLERQKKQHKHSNP